MGLEYKEGLLKNKLAFSSDYYVNFLWNWLNIQANYVFFLT